MKKIYMTPQTEEVKVSIQQLMQAGSTPSVSITNTEIEDNDFGSRGGGWFDDDDY